jgi:hypothetical protein
MGFNSAFKGLNYTVLCKQPNVRRVVGRNRNLICGKIGFSFSRNRLKPGITYQDCLCWGRFLNLGGGVEFPEYNAGVLPSCSLVNILALQLSTLTKITE